MRIDQTQQRVDHDHQDQDVHRPVDNEAQHLRHQQDPVQRRSDPGQPHQDDERQRDQQGRRQANPVEPRTRRQQRAQGLDQPLGQGPGELHQRVVAGKAKPGQVDAQQQRGPDQGRDGVQQLVKEDLRQHRVNCPKRPHRL
jgi:hypothetical protein